MERPVNRYKVKKLTGIDTTLYLNGDIFYTDKAVGILIDNKIKAFPTTQPSVKDFVKKEEVTTMIDEAIAGIEGKS
ncbi:MAG: hypothetical protein L0K90_05530 [Staphylococcus equorum]|nr:hypothetical protein [Staphylococcus equorum]